MRAEFVAADGVRGRLHQAAHGLSSGNRRWPDERFVKSKADSIYREYLDTLSKPRLVAEQPPQFGLQCACQRAGKGCQQDSGLWCVRARDAARCSATIVLPVPAEPETRAGPV